MKSYFSSKLEVRPCNIGKGIFVVQPIAKGELLLDFNQGPGRRLKTKEAYKHEARGCHYIIQIEDHWYWVKVDGPEQGDFINHSCEPSCGIDGRLRMVAMRDLRPGEEITFDYAMTESYYWYKLECACGMLSCRKVVTGSDWKRRDLQIKYKGYFADYIQKKIDRNSVHKLVLEFGEKVFRRTERLLWIFRKFLGLIKE